MLEKLEIGISFSKIEQEYFDSMLLIYVKMYKEKASARNEVFTQHYTHARHQEWQRTIFTGTFTGIIGVVIGLVFAGENASEDLTTQLLTVGILGGLSIMGFFLTFKWSFTMSSLILKANMLAEITTGLDNRYLANDINKLSRLPSVSDIFATYYILLSCGFFSSMLYLYSTKIPDEETIFWITVYSFVVFIISGAISYCFYHYSKKIRYDKLYLMFKKTSCNRN